MTAFDALFSDAFQLFDETFSSTVTYRRGEDSLSVSVLDGNISNEEQIEYGANFIKEGRVFQILKTDLILDSVQVAPASLDTIEDSRGDFWEVCSFPNLVDYETDVNPLYWRIRTIKVLGS